MARRDRRLGVWLDGVRVADLETAGERIRCRYTEEALERWPLNSPLLSCSLPLDSRPADALPFCVGLLPEGQALQALAQQAALPVTDAFGLLARYGRDVAGALVIMPGDDPPDPSEFGVQPYDAAALEGAVAELDDFPLGVHDDSELSLAGIQDKLLLVQLPDGAWGRPTGGRPSTHILKRDDLRYPGLIEAEAHCLLLARSAGLTTVDVELTELASYPCLIVSRYDREVVGTEEVRRIHQEDLCQALAIDPRQNRGRAKYERAGGPSLRQAAQLLGAYAADGQLELDRLIAAVTFAVLIGNSDAHGKNLSLLHPDPENVALAPLYDTVPTALWPRLRTEAAMAIGGQPMLPDVGLADILREAIRWPHPSQRVGRIAGETVEAVLAALEAERIPADGEVAKLISKRGKRLLAKTAS
ncbi:MAG TPA: HipA domain-containing protein [Solirubrobacterales bacterium]|nr:HipA domain-containing protein [Solirubrobacterales bacterium]